MDLHLVKETPTDAERAAVDEVLREHGVQRTHEAAPAGHGAPALHSQSASENRHLLLPALHAVQRARGFVSRGALGYVSRVLAVPPAEAFGVASFYAMFALAERPARTVHVCDDVVCRARGAEALFDGAADHGARGGHAGSEAHVGRAPCLGQCDRAPVALVVEAGATPREWAEERVTPEALVQLRAGRSVRPTGAATIPQRRHDAASLVLLRRVGVVDPTDLAAYRHDGGFSALRKALDLGSAAVIREVDAAGLQGRGGAAFPTGKKWAGVARASARDRYVVCNADESEPGTFKDRVLLEEDPFAIVEAMTIAGFAVGAEKGIVYLRAEYPLAHARLTEAIALARSHGYLGPRVMGREVSFDIEVRRGAGAYICGEETALFASIEGFRGEPRTKPPFPSDKGLFGKPTVVNNVETLANVLPILRDGAAAYRRYGTDASPGTRLFCVSGNVALPGLYELPHGRTLRHLFELAGGLPAGRSLRAVLLGGAAGTFVAPDELDVELSFEGARAKGKTLGSGVAAFFDDSVDLMPILTRLARFFRDESCGQCVPCRIGTVRQEELIQRIARNAPRPHRRGELALLGELGQAMRDASICGLGQTASSAIESAFACLPALGDAGDPGREAGA